MEFRLANFSFYISVPCMDSLQIFPVQVHHEGLAWCRVACITVALLQLASSVLVAFLTVYSLRFSSQVRARCAVYDDVGGAPARMLMPVKTHTYAASCDNAATSEEEVPLCGASLNNDQMHKFPLPYQLPLWALPSDSSGLLNLAETLVRLILMAFHLLRVEAVP
jgi:hypothetical protein